MNKRFHHSSFFAGDVVEAAGILVCERGENLILYPHSGHYRPKDKHFLHLLLMLQHNRVNLSKVMVDVQRTLRTARLILPGGEKVKKKETAWMWSAVTLRDFLVAKVGAWDRGLFQELIQEAVRRAFIRSSGSLQPMSDVDLRNKAAWENAFKSLEVLTSIGASINDRTNSDLNDCLEPSDKTSDVDVRDYPSDYSRNSLSDVAKDVSLQNESPDKRVKDPYPSVKNACTTS